MKDTNERIQQATATHGDLPVLYGTGYPCEQPHILVWYGSHGNPDYVIAYPEGNNGLHGMGAGTPEFTY